MKLLTIIYLSLIGLFLIIATLLLVIYYTQDFNYEYNFVSSLSYDDLTVEKYNNNYYGNSNQEEFIQSAEAVIGNIELENNGIFTKIYRSPNIVGCLEFKEELSQEYSYALENTPVRISIDAGETTYYNYYTTQTIEVPVGAKKEYSLTGRYEAYVPLSEFSKNKLSGISIYIMDPKEKNPIDNDYNYGSYNRNYNSDCNMIKDRYQKAATILIN